MFATTTAVSAGPFRLRDMTYHPGASQAYHAHDEFQISLLLRGRMEEATAGGSRVALPGQVLIKAPGTYHSNVFGPEGVRILCIDGDASADQTLKEALRDVAYFPAHGGPVARAAIDVLRAFRLGADLSDPIAELIGALPARSGFLRVDDTVAQQAARVVRERFAAPIALADVAAAVGVHRTHLARQFRRAFGQSVGDYLRACRVQHATHLIASTALPLADIALQSGFADQPHLTRTLQASLGVSPRRFRVLVG